MGLGEVLLAMWLSFAPNQGMVLKPAVAPAEAGVITVVKMTQMVKGTDSEADFAVATRPWAPEGGVPQWCNVGVMDGPRWEPRSTGEALNQETAMMFFLAHEVGHCVDSRPFELVADQKTRREAFADAFSACVVTKAGRRSDLEAIARARHGELGDNMGRRMRKAIEKASKRPECQASKGAASEDFVDAWNAASAVDAEVFGEKGRSNGAPAPAPATAMARQGSALAAAARH